MAPIPTTFEQDTIELIENIDRRQRDLSEFQIPRLRDCVGPLATQQQYAGEVREDIDVLARIIEVRLLYN